MAKRKQDDDAIPILHVRKGATMKEIYAKAKETFTAADLAKYANDEEGIPIADVIAKMEATHRAESRKRPGVKKGVKRQASATRRTKPASNTNQARSASKKKSAKPSGKRTVRSRKKDDDVMPILHVRKGATLKEIYARFREEFTAADLAKYLQDEEYVPAAEAIAYLEAVEREVSAPKPRSKNKKA